MRAVGFGAEDAESEVARFARKVANLRVFENETGKMMSSVLETGGEALVVSQFTLIADTAKGNRARASLTLLLRKLLSRSMRRSAPPSKPRASACTGVPSERVWRSSS